LKIHPEAIGYHFSAPNSGIRSVDINEKNALAETDHKIYSRRLHRWKQRATERRNIELQKRVVLEKEVAEKRPKLEPRKMTCVINCGDNPDVIKSAIRRFAPIADSI
jgi:hypothetical protein